MPEKILLQFLVVRLLPKEYDVMLDDGVRFIGGASTSDIWKKILAINPPLVSQHLKTRGGLMASNMPDDI